MPPARDGPVGLRCGPALGLRRLRPGVQIPPASRGGGGCTPPPGCWGHDRGPGNCGDGSAACLAVHKQLFFFILGKIMVEAPPPPALADRTVASPGFQTGRCAHRGKPTHVATASLLIRGSGCTVIKCLSSLTEKWEHPVKWSTQTQRHFAQGSLVQNDRR